MKKRLFSTLLCLCLALILLPVIALADVPQTYPIGPNGEMWEAPTTSWSTVSATAGADYVQESNGNVTIKTAAGLAWLARQVNGGNLFTGKTVTLAADLDMKDHIWTPMGDLYRCLMGTFDGGGHSISGLYYNGDATFIGLFGVLFGTVQNVSVVNSYLCSSDDQYSDSDSVYVGGVVGYNAGTVVNCFSSGSVAASSGFSGGIGGVVGCNEAGTVANCFNSGSVTVSGDDVRSLAGGIVGKSYRGTIVNCFNSGSVTSGGGGSQFAGGVTGGISDGDTITNCYSRSGCVEGGHGGVNGVVLPASQMTAAANAAEPTGASPAWVNITVGSNSLGKAALVAALRAGVTAYNTTHPDAAGAWAQQGNMNGGYPFLEASAYTVTNNLTNIASDNTDACRFKTETAAYTAALSVSGDYLLPTSITVKVGDTPLTAGTDYTYVSTSGALTIPAAKITGNIEITAAGVPLYPIGEDGALLPAPEGSWRDNTTGATFDGVSHLTIYTAADLAAFAAAVNGGNDFSGETVTLAADLNMNAHSWTPIGDETKPFRGVFDGGGHSISGLYYHGSAKHVGLFGFVENGTVQNVSVVNSYLRSSEPTGVYIGGVAGINKGVITNCRNTGEISATTTSAYITAFAGGVAGSNDGAITNCRNTGGISATGVGASTNAYAGGTAGCNNGTIANCRNSGEISATANDYDTWAYAGGVAGYQAAGLITNCFSTGSIEATGYYAYAGAVVGYSHIGTIANCYYATGTASQGIGNYIDAAGATTVLPTSQMTAAANATSGDGWADITVESNSLGKIALVDALNAGAAAYNGTTTDARAEAWAQQSNMSGGYPFFAASAYTVTNTLTNISSGNADAYRGKMETADYTAALSVSGSYLLPTSITVKVGDTPLTAGTDYTYVSESGELTIPAAKITGNIEIIAAGVPGYPIGVNGALLPAPVESWEGYTTGATFDGWRQLTIYTAADLAAFAAAVNGGNSFSGRTVTLAADLNMSAHSWTPIGNDLKHFKGVFNGGGHSVSGLYYHGSAQNAGLFGFVDNGRVQNVSVVNSYLRSETYNANTGGVAGSNFGTVINCCNTGSVSTNADTTTAGGVAGINGGTMINCYNTGSVSATGSSSSDAGGVVGVNGGTMINCYSTGSVSVSDGIIGNYAGGVAGSVYSGAAIANCYYTAGTVSQGVGTGTSAAGAITALPASQMTAAANATNGDGWVDITVGSNSLGKIALVDALNAGAAAYNDTNPAARAAMWSQKTGVNNGCPYPALSITTQPADQSAEEGTTATFTVEATGYPAPAYQWEISDGGVWTEITSATGASYTTQIATKAMNGYQFRCIVNNNEASETSAVATLTVTDATYTMDFSQTHSVMWGSFTDHNFSTTDASAPGWSWDASEKCLSLSGLDFTTTAVQALSVPDGTRLHVSNTNEVTIRCHNNTTATSVIATSGTADASVVFDGTGTLTAAAVGTGCTGDIYGLKVGGGAEFKGGDFIFTTKDAETTGGSYGVYAGGAIAVTGGTVMAASGNAGSTNGRSIAICGGSTPSIRNSTVTATSGEAAVSMAICGSVYDSASGDFAYDAPDLSGYTYGCIATASTDASGTPEVPYSAGEVTSYSYFHAEPVPAYTMDFQSGSRKTWGGFDNHDFTADDASGTGWSWDASEKLLTLHNFQFETSAATAIILPSGAKVVLEGDNRVASLVEDEYGLYGSGDVTFLGSGSLECSGGRGIHAGSITINGCDVTGVSRLDSNASGVSCAGDILVTGGGSLEGRGSSGIKLTGEGGITVNGGSAAGYGAGDVGIQAPSVSVTDGTLTAASRVVAIIAPSISLSGCTATASENTNGEPRVPFNYDACSSYKYMHIGPICPVAVTYDLNGGSGTMPADTATAYVAFTLPDCAFTPPADKQFDQWAIGAADSDLKAAASSVYIFTADTTVYALWKDLPPVIHTVTYDSNGGGGTMPAGTVAAGESFTLPACTFTPPAGKQFDQWAIGAADSDLKAAANSGYTFTANTTVYALWLDLPPVTYTVTYDSNGGGGTMPAGAVAAGESFTLPACTFTPPIGKQFDRWTIGAADSDIQAAANSVYTFTADTTVYALWANLPPVTHAVSVSASPAEGGTVTGGGEFADNSSVTVTAASNTDYTFVCWRENGAVVSQSADYTFTLTAERTLVSEFRYTPPHISSTPRNYTLAFETNGGSAISSVTAAEHSSVSLSGYVPTRDGWEFTGWYADSSLTERVTSVRLTGNTTVCAGWNKLPSLDNFQLTGVYNGYSDVDESRWYGTENEGTIRDAALLGLMEGYGNGDFGPEDELKVSEAIKIACRIHSIYLGDGYDFTQGETWYDVYVDYAIANGIIKSGDFTDFTANCTRAQAAYILAHALPGSELAATKTLTPPDVAITDPYGAEIHRLYAAGVLCGTDENGTFLSDAPFTRAQAAAIATRLCMPDKRQTA